MNTISELVRRQCKTYRPRGSSAPLMADVSLSPLPARMLFVADENHELTKTTGSPIQQPNARRATLQASFDTGQVADELRRHQKGARPGQSSPPIVQLRGQQATARQVSKLSRQSFIRAATAFVRDAGIEVPRRMALEMFITPWIVANVPA